MFHRTNGLFIRMPHTQVSPPVRQQPQGGAGMMVGRQSGAPGGGWQAMPPSIPPHLPPGNSLQFCKQISKII